MDSKRSDTIPIPSNKGLGDFWEHKYSTNDINKAGKTIINDSLTEGERKEAKEIVNDWRGAHSVPMKAIYLFLKNKCVKLDIDEVLIVKRLKRLDSIVDKLKRPEGGVKHLWCMQDLGGCRVVVPDIQTMDRVVKELKNSRVKHSLKDEDDYVSNPKKSGYRSIHLMYKYHSDRNPQFNRNMIIEVQIRTRLQHLWATSVESVGQFNEQALKSGVGNEDYKYFFVLVSSLFATMEGRPVIPGTSADKEMLIKEIKEIDEKKGIIGVIETIPRVKNWADNLMSNLKVHGVKGEIKVAYYLLELNRNTHTLQITLYKEQGYQAALNEYMKVENEHNGDIDVVLVSAESYTSLEEAYPNYFSDLSDFLKVICKAIGRQQFIPAFCDNKKSDGSELEDTNQND